MTARIRSFTKVPLLLAAALALPACYVGPPPGYHYADRTYSGRHARPVDQIDGFVTFEGRCPTLREHGSNDVFTLTGNTRALRPGDHVRLSEREVEGNPCGGDAPTLEVTEIDAIWRGEGHRDAYFDARHDGDFDRFLSENRDRGGWYADRYAYRTGNVDRNGDSDGPDRRYESPPYVPNTPNAEPEEEDEHEQLSVTGRLELGGHCPAIQTPQGDSWDLVGNLGDYRDGDRVNVIGIATGRSTCGGRALTISEIHGR